MASSMACATGRPSLPISRRCEEKTGLSTPSRPLPRARGGTRLSLPLLGAAPLLSQRLRTLMRRRGRFLSSAAAASHSRRPAPISPQRRRPTRPPPKPLLNQIPINGEPLTSHAGSFFGGFRTPALGTAPQVNDGPASETVHRRWLGCLPKPLSHRFQLPPKIPSRYRGAM